MNSTLRRGMLVVGLVVLLAALGALTYAYWPLGSLQEQIPLAATLFAPP